MAPESSSSSESSCTSPTGPKPQSGRFSEVAQCMLEIIEDLQNQTQLPGLVQPGSTPVSPPAPAPSAPDSQPFPNPSSPSRAADVGMESKGFAQAGLWGIIGPEMSSSLLQRQRTGMRPGSDYHVYEEIMYELTTRPRSDPGPPPLPARPDGIFRTSSLVKKASTSRPPSKSHRPKQRSNLYSPLREPGVRHDALQSVEQEYRGSAVGITPLPKLGQTRCVLGPRNRPEQDRIKQPEEEYGFRVGP